MRRAPQTFRGDLLIDGYNLLHAAGLARRTYGPGEFERTRRRLLKLLAVQLFRGERERTTVVFDARERLLGPTPPTTIDGIRVLFADGDADSEIERLIQRNSAPRRLHVVSSDHRLQRAARRRRAKFFDSEAFLSRIAARPTPEERRQLAEPAEKREGLSAPAEVDAWLRAFGEIDATLASDVQPIQGKAPPAAKPDAKLQQPSGSQRRPDRPPKSDELKFWEQRIAELWEQTDAGGDDRSSQRR